eukprot:3345398-Prymnesium_polylepis.1
MCTVATSRCVIPSLSLPAKIWSTPSRDRAASDAAARAGRASPVAARGAARSGTAPCWPHAPQ